MYTGLFADDKTIGDKSKCRKCKYRCTLGSHIYCDYLAKTGKPRQLVSPSGDACTVFEAGKPQREERDFVVSLKASAAHKERKKTPKPAPKPRVSKLDEAKAKELHAQGLTDTQIGAAFGLSKYTIRSWRLSNNLPVNRKERAVRRTVNDADIVALHNRGLSDKQVAAQLSISPSSVSRALRMNGIHRGHHIVPVQGRPVGSDAWEIFESMNSAERITGVNRFGIKACIAGKQKSTHGWEWRRAE